MKSKVLILIAACSITILAFIGCTSVPNAPAPTTQQIADARAQGAAEGQKVGQTVGTIATTATGNPLWAVVGSVVGGLAGGLIGGMTAGKKPSPQLEAAVNDIRTVAAAVIPAVAAVNPKAGVIAGEAATVINAALPVTK